MAGRVRRQPEQAEVVAAVGADVVALQEVTARTLPLWRDALAEAGFAARGVRPRRPPEATGRRLLGVLTAAREPLERLPEPADVPWPERCSGCRTGGVEVLNLHSPIAPAPELARSAPTRRSPPTSRRCRRRRGSSAATSTRRAASCPGGDVLTFAFDSAARLRPERGERWDAAERALVHDLRARHGWTDAYRALHGYGERSASWTFKDDRGGWRLDHVLVARARRRSRAPTPTSGAGPGCRITRRWSPTWRLQGCQLRLGREVEGPAGSVVESRGPRFTHSHG